MGRVGELPVDRETIQQIRIQIATAMKMRALNQSEFAELIGLNRSQVARLFTMKRWNPNIATLQRIATALDMGLMIHIRPNGGK